MNALSFFATLLVSNKKNPIQLHAPQCPPPYKKMSQQNSIHTTPRVVADEANTLVEMYSAQKRVTISSHLHRAFHRYSKLRHHWLLFLPPIALLRKKIQLFQAPVEVLEARYMIY